MSCCGQLLERQKTSYYAGRQTARCTDGTERELIRKKTDDWCRHLKSCCSQIFPTLDPGVRIGTQQGKGKGKQNSSRTLLEALAQAIDGTNEDEAVRLAAEFNDSFGHLVRASVDVESVRGSVRGRDDNDGHDSPIEVVRRGPEKVLERQRDETRGNLSTAEEKDVLLVSSDDSDVTRPKKKKSRKNNSKKKRSKTTDPPSSSDHSSSSSSSSTSDSSSDDSSQVEDAELCYEITEFGSADLPDLPEKWDKGFRKLRSYVPLTLFNPALLESFYEEEGEGKDKTKSGKSKSSLKLLERQMTYGEFIEMSDLEERYAREIYGLDTYADYVVKHKKIVSDLKKTYNCWMIGLRYHLKVRTVIFRRRKLIKSKVKGKTVLKDKFLIPNGLQPLVERQARHDADRAGDLQHVDNPYAPGGVKFGFNFATGRPSAANQTVLAPVKALEDSSTNLRGKRGGLNQKPFVRRNNFAYPRLGRFGNQNAYQNEAYHAQMQPPMQPHYYGPMQMQQPHQGRPYVPYRGARLQQPVGLHKNQTSDPKAM